MGRSLSDFWPASATHLRKFHERSTAVSNPPASPPDLLQRLRRSIS